MKRNKFILRNAGVLAVGGALAACMMLTVSCVSFGSGEKDAVADLKAAVQETVADVVRADAMLKAVDEMVAVIESLDKLIDSQRAQLNAQIQDYSTTRKALDASLDNKMKARQALIDSFAKAHYDFKSQATAKEWKKLSKVEKEALAWVVQNSLEGGA
jgi:hypothetical protein